MNGESIRAYQFAGFSFNLAKRRLSGPDGAVIPLSGRAYDVLAFLVENRDRVVGKDELIKAVWPQSIVEDNNLNQAISTVRRALGDSRDVPRFIVTVAGRGYQFIGDVVPLAEASAELTRCRRARADGCDAPAGAGRCRTGLGVAASRASPAPDQEARVSRRAVLSGAAVVAAAAVGTGSGGIERGSDRACRSRSRSCRSSHCCRRPAIRRWNSVSPSS